MLCFRIVLTLLVTLMVLSVVTFGLVLTFNGASFSFGLSDHFQRLQNFVWDWWGGRKMSPLRNVTVFVGCVCNFEVFTFGGGEMV